jgi:phosphatidylethanolamine-binding protein (PEBP) family uncharacterized protein
MQNHFIFYRLYYFLQVFLFAQKTFTLSSKDLGGSFTIQNEFNGFGCNGNNASPQLAGQMLQEPKEVLRATRSDAPTGAGWWHWVAFNIPSNSNEIVSKAINLI